MFRRHSLPAVLGAVALAGVLLPAAPASAEGPAPDHVVLALLQGYHPTNQFNIEQGESILFADVDPTAGPGHSFTEDVPEGVTPRFDSDVVPPGMAKEVPNVPSLPPGTYPVRCKIHPVVNGTLTVG